MRLPWFGRKRKSAEPQALAGSTRVHPTPDRTWLRRSTVATDVDVEIFFGSLRSRAVVENHGALVDHYREVLHEARARGASYKEFSHLLWLRLHVSCSAGHIPFPWYDTLEPMLRLFHWLEHAEEDSEWWDGDQGWELHSILRGPLFHFRLGDFEENDEILNVAVPRDLILESAAVVRGRAQTIVARLAGAMGEDYWTRYRYDLRTDLPEEYRRRFRPPE